MKDIRNILLGITFLFVGYFLAYKIHIENSEGLKAMDTAFPTEVIGTYTVYKYTKP